MSNKVLDTLRRPFTNQQIDYTADFCDQLCNKYETELNRLREIDKYTAIQRINGRLMFHDAGTLETLLDALNQKQLDLDTISDYIASYSKQLQKRFIVELIKQHKGD